MQIPIPCSCSYRHGARGISVERERVQNALINRERDHRGRDKGGRNGRAGRCDKVTKKKKKKKKKKKEQIDR